MKNIKSFFAPFLMAAFLLLIPANAVAADSNLDLSDEEINELERLEDLVRGGSTPAVKQDKSADKVSDEKRKKAEAARLADEKRKKAEAARLADEKRKKAEAARLADEKRKKTEVARLADEKRKKTEAARKASEEAAAMAPDDADASSAAMLKVLEAKIGILKIKQEAMERKLNNAGANAGSGGIEISGFVDMSYFSDPNSDTATFGMDQAEVDIEHSIGKKASMRIDLEYSDDGSAATTDAAIEQGFININVSSVTLTFGKFNAPIGFELLDAPDMYQYSHALVFNYGLPTNLTGAMVSGGSGIIDYAVYYVNGWDNNYDDNTDKHIGTRIGITPGKTLNIGLSYISGKIGTGTGKVAQTITDIDLTYTPSEQFTLGFEYNMGVVKDSSNVDAGDAKWNGYMLMGHYDFNDTYGLTLRLDSFNDEDDYAIGAGFGKETRTATTVALTFGIADGFGGLIEYRSDKSDVEVFTDKDNNPKDSESTLALEITYSF